MKKEDLSLDWTTDAEIKMGRFRKNGRTRVDTLRSIYGADFAAGALAHEPRLLLDRSSNVAKPFSSPRPRHTPLLAISIAKTC